ncbi:MAG TPA: glycosyltransferase family 2 protein [Mycobacteriales bacterium]|nr:glycosyltransferase family 2 protein [Mycobacteriales bacterium]
MDGGPGTDAASRTVGVVIVSYDSGPVVEAAIDAVAAQAPTAIVVVDNAPTASPDLARAAAAHPDLVVIHRPDNPGFCAGNNIGVAALPPTEFVLFLNPDAIVSAGFLEAAVDALDANPRAGAVGPKLVRLDPDSLAATGEIDCAGICTTWYGRTYDRGQGTPDDGRFDGPAEAVPALCAAAMFCRRTALDDVADEGQIFDEAFFMYKDDIDLSYRLRAKGWSLLYVPALVAGHVRGAHGVRADRASRRRFRMLSLSNDWRVWRKGLMPAPLRLAMLGYLVAKTAVLRLVPWWTP